MSTRWKMNRIGFVNFWLYDEETFEFEDGKLLLRGQNGSGKSITTQSFIPFILDGDRTPSRLDPFGSSDRRMEYYFLGEEGKDEATGYLFLEFCKKETGEYRTIGIGQRARRGKPMDFWGFILLDQRRVGLDFNLYREVGSSRLPLTKAELKRAIGEGNPFTEVPGEYKALVNKYIFGFRKQEQYEQFIRLLVKVRAPKLSKEFKPTKVYDILNESLQTLTDEDLRAMVDAMEKMDAIQESLDQLRRALGDVRKIRTEYTRYNQFMLARKGQLYLDKKRETEQAAKKLSQQEARKEEMLGEQKDKTGRQGEIADRDKILETELESLYDQDMADADRKLELARKRWAESQGQLQKWEEKINTCRSELAQQDRQIHELQGKLSAVQSDLGSSREELEREQEILSWEQHGEAVRLIDQERPQEISGILTVFGEWKKGLQAAKAALEQLEHAQKEYDQAAEELAKLERDLEKKQQAEETAQQNLVDEQDNLIREFFALPEQNEEWKLSESVLRETEIALKSYSETSDAEKIRQLLRKDYEQTRQARKDEWQDAWRRLAQQKEELAKTEEELNAVQSQKEIEPLRSPAVEASRSALRQAGICAVPFFKAVEFADEMDETEKAQLEAQLEKTGILDALVVADADLPRIREWCPEFLDTILWVEGTGASTFDRLAANDELEPPLKQAAEKILSHITITPGTRGEICLAADGSFRQGILRGRAKKTGEAEFVGRLARERRRQLRIQELEAHAQEIRVQIGQVETEAAQLALRLEKLDQEFQNSPDFMALNQALEQIRVCRWEREQVNSAVRQQEKRTGETLARRQNCYQQMLHACRGYSCGRTTTEYQNALDAAEEYLRIWQDVRWGLNRLEQCRLEIRNAQDMTDRLEAGMDEAFIEKRRCTAECEQQNVRIRKYEEYLARPEIREQAERIARIREERGRLTQERSELGKRLAVIEEKLREIQEEEAPRKQKLQELIIAETGLARNFEEELALKLVFDRETESLPACAAKAQEFLREGDRMRDSSELTSSLFQVLQKNNGNLTPYGTSTEKWFEEETKEQQGDSSPSLRSRIRIVSVWKGRKVYLEEFYRILKDSIDETEMLIQQKDRELFEDILSQTISRQLTDRIAESRRWAQDMSALMKNLDTSMGLRFSLDWKPRSAENDGELEIRELEQILLRDRALLTTEDMMRVAAHFRSRVRTEKQRQEETGGPVNYMELVRDALDYRKWFEFRMYYRRGEEPKKPLTNAAFNRFSGGEKAMAMYVPLFAAVNAQYQKAEKEDYPRMIALDEAFAGVDDKNISSMFELVEILDYDYIMNSQVLWGCYANVSALKIIELCRPANSPVVTPIRYTWNGKERILDEQ